MAARPLSAIVVVWAMLAITDGGSTGTLSQHQRLPSSILYNSEVVNVPLSEVVFADEERVADESENLEVEETESDSPSALDVIIKRACTRHDIDCNLVHAVIQVESNYRHDAVSVDGARGLMQIIPSTAEHLGISDPSDPAQNVDGGVRYLKSLLSMFNNNISFALAAYNAGPQRVIQHNGVPPYRETKRYVALVLQAKAAREKALS